MMKIPDEASRRCETTFGQGTANLQSTATIMVTIDNNDNDDDDDNTEYDGGNDVNDNNGDKAKELQIPKRQQPSS